MLCHISLSRRKYTRGEIRIVSQRTISDGLVRQGVKGVHDLLLKVGTRLRLGRSTNLLLSLDGLALCGEMQFPPWLWRLHIFFFWPKSVMIQKQGNQKANYTWACQLTEQTNFFIRGTTLPLAISKTMTPKMGSVFGTKTGGQPNVTISRFIIGACTYTPPIDMMRNKIMATAIASMWLLSLSKKTCPWTCQGPTNP